MVAMPYIGYARRAFWNERALVPAIFRPSQVFRCLVMQAAIEGLL